MCFYLMLNLIGETWVRFLVWMAIGLVVYFAYGRSHSRLASARGGAEADPGHDLTRPWSGGDLPAAAVCCAGR